MSNKTSKTGPEFEKTLTTVMTSILESGKNERATKNSNELFEMAEQFKLEDPEEFYFKFTYEKELLRDDAVELAMKLFFKFLLEASIFSFFVGLTGIFILALVNFIFWILF
jgi:hypothetical protein